ncbi:MAG: ATP-binding cassette domain-containing protein [Deinococcales bacterium]
MTKALISLIPRFYDVSSGRILIDGQDVRDVQVKSLRSHISIVLQTPVLFSGSIRQTSSMASPEPVKKNSSPHVRPPMLMTLSKTWPRVLRVKWARVAAFYRAVKDNG